jgi:hypothetical protein
MARKIHFLAHAKFRQISSGAVANVYGTVFKNYFVGSAFRPFKDFVRRLGAFEVDGRQIRPEMERDRRSPIALLKHRREQVLPSVLLHVIEASRPVDATENVRTVGAAIDDMNNFVSIVAYVEHIGVSDFS